MYFMYGDVESGYISDEGDVDSKTIIGDLDFEGAISRLDDDYGVDIL